MRPRIKTLPGPAKDSSLSPFPVPRRATYWETCRPLGPQSQPIGPRKSISPPHKRLQFRDLPSHPLPPFEAYPEISALQVVLPDLLSLLSLPSDHEMTAILNEVDDIIATSRHVLRMGSNSELRSVLKKSKSVVSSIEPHSEKRRYRMVRRSEVPQSSRIAASKARKLLDSKEMSEGQNSPNTSYDRSESCERVGRRKNSQKFLYTPVREAGEWHSVGEGYSSGKLKALSVVRTPGAALILTKAIPLRPLSSKRVLRRLDRLQTQRDSQQVVFSESRRH